MTVSSLEPIEQARKYVDKKALVTTVGIEPSIRKGLTRYDIEQLVIYAGTADDVSNWLFADVLAEVEARVFRSEKCPAAYEIRDTAWQQLADIYGRNLHHSTMLNMRAVANAFPYDRRRHNQVVHFSHHKALVSYPPDLQEHYLDLCEDYGWSVHRLEHELYGKHHDSEALEERGLLTVDTVLQMLDRIGIHVRRKREDLVLLNVRDVTLELRAVVDPVGNPKLIKNVALPTNGGSQGGNTHDEVRD